MPSDVLGTRNRLAIDDETTRAGILLAESSPTALTALFAEKQVTIRCAQEWGQENTFTVNAYDFDDKGENPKPFSFDVKVLASDFSYAVENRSLPAWPAILNVIVGELTPKLDKDRKLQAYTDEPSLYGCSKTRGSMCDFATIIARLTGKRMTATPMMKEDTDMTQYTDILNKSVTEPVFVWSNSWRKTELLDDETHFRMVRGWKKGEEKRTIAYVDFIDPQKRTENMGSPDGETLQFLSLETFKVPPNNAADFMNGDQFQDVHIVHPSDLQSSKKT
ncbi:hypothetical protein QFC22_000648 [Naganishia vaughanmartiniae]|uniref:Uncharacterized protein n=1 Tax=Naganishia vaughanmartiniae TaxID=1424756 RepID=A0ACC2XQP3_9TREE|nr:hypothetical protein QFC22_000648 [Naganishia vaughanmartiniae]